MNKDKLQTFKVGDKTCIALVRKLTEKECGRLMGLDDKDIITIQNSGVSRSAQYKMYGNSIVVDVLYHIFRKLFVERGNEGQQLSIFDFTNHTDDMVWNHEHPLRVVSLCAGYDSQCLALERLKRNFPPFDYELIAWAEFDPESNAPIDKQPAVVAHKALFPQWADKNLGDMTKIDWTQVPDFDLLTYSTPCQSVSQAGLQHGFTEGSGTRSSIIWDVRYALQTKKPRYAILENVAAMVSEKFLPMFNLWRNEVRRIGYENFAQLLNSKNYGVPQNRERIFLVSIYDTTHTIQYNFPQPVKLDTKLADLLEDETSTKYYLNPQKVQDFVRDNMAMIDKYVKEDDSEIEPLPEHLKKWLEDFEDAE